MADTQMTSTGAPRVAPEAPGRLGSAIAPEELLPYLTALDAWRGERKQELDRLDAASLRATDSASYTNDITLSMAIWQSVTQRWERLTTLWDSGRADARAREEMSRVIHGSGAAAGPGGAPAPGGMGLSLVEATRLSDALVTSLRARLAFDPVAADVAARLATLRAGLQRSARLAQDGAPAGQPGQPDLASLSRRLESLTRTASQGGDVTGPLQFLEADIARAERDLIVAHATHRDLGRDFRAVITRRAALSAHEDEIRALAARCAAEVTPIPRLAVPDVESLGRVPQSRAELDRFAARLDQVERALAVVQAAYAKPLDQLAELTAQVQSAGARARAAGAYGGPFAAALKATGDQAQVVLASRPCPLDVVRATVQAYENLLTAATLSQPGSQG